MLKNNKVEDSIYSIKKNKNHLDFENSPYLTKIYNLKMIIFLIVFYIRGDNNKKS